MGLPAGATGTVSFFTSTNAPLCSFTLNGSTTSCTTSATLAAGTYSGVYATFVDTDGNYNGSTSTNTVALTVNKANAPFSVTVNGSSSAATITYGSSATLAEVGLPAGATGTVSFFTSTNAPLCSFTLNGSTTSCTTSATLAAGTYSGVYATFVDTDGNYNGSTSTNTVALDGQQGQRTVQRDGERLIVGRHHHLRLERHPR